LLFHTLHMWCFALPPIVALLTRILARSMPEAQVP
jgi:hypothetical protein